MNLPNANNAIVEPAKVLDYLLASDHPEGSGKAEFFSRFGFAADQWEVLAAALLAHAQAHAVSSTAESNFGTKYRIDGPLLCPDGRAPTVRTVWIIDRGRRRTETGHGSSSRVVCAHDSRA